LKLTQELKEKGFIKSVVLKDKNVLILTTPCRIRIKQSEVIKLKENYLSNEEIGGVMWATPTIVNMEKVYLVNKIKIIRNVIEENPRYDNGRLLNKGNAYMRDMIQYEEERKIIFDAGCLPIRFHTHPTKGKNIFDNVKNQQEQTDTSDQDQIESQYFEPIDNHCLLMPRALIVGNKDMGNDLFIGVYDGFIAPPGFEESKRKVTLENMNNIGKIFSNKISPLNFSDDEKIAYGIGAILSLSYMTYKTRRFSIPVIIGLAAAGSMFLLNTGIIEQQNYFNKLLFGDAYIYIPEEDGEYFPN
jgi:hypothetical protein